MNTIREFFPPKSRLFFLQKRARQSLLPLLVKPLYGMEPSVVLNESELEESSVKTEFYWLYAIVYAYMAIGKIHRIFLVIFEIKKIKSSFA